MSILLSILLFKHLLWAVNLCENLMSQIVTLQDFSVTWFIFITKLVCEKNLLHAIRKLLRDYKQ